MKKRALSLFLSLLMMTMCFGLTSPSTTASAEGTVVYVNGEAETNGSGTKDSPYNTLLNAVKALQTTGGTIVVTGVTELPGNDFVNNAKITITSHDGTTDYRGTLNAETGLVSGAQLYCKLTSPLNFNSGYAGEVEFNNLNIVWAYNYTAINLGGRKLTFGENTRWYEQKNRNTDFYVDGFSETIRLYGITTDKELTQSAVTTFNSGAGSAVTKVITGERCKMTTAGHIFNIDGYVKELHISTESNNNTSGKLTVDGDVKINIGQSGNIGKLTVATAPSANTKGMAGKKLLDKINGALSIAVNNGGAITTNELSLASEDYTINKMFIVNGAENLTVVNGDISGSFVVTTDTDFNAAVITDENGDRTVKYLSNKAAEFVLTKSGTYNVTLENIEIPKYTVTFKDYDGTTKGTFTAEEGSVITEFPKNPFREGYEFVMWSVDGKNPVTDVTNSDVTANAVYREETRKVVFVNGEVETGGNGKTPDTPFNTFANAANAVKSGGIIVVMGVTDIASIANTAPILVTSVYNGEDYRGSLQSDSSLSGAYLHHNSSSPYGVSSSTRGFIEFDNINLLMRAQYGAINFAGHPFGLGSGIHIYEPTTNSTSCTTFRESTTFQLRSYGIETNDSGEETEILESIIDGKIKYNSYYLGARGKRTIPGRIITVNGSLNNLYVSNDIKGATQGLLSIKGDVKVTVNGSITNITTATNSGVSGLDKFEGNLSVIVNPGATLGSVKDAAKPTSGKFVQINVSDGGTVTHTDNSLGYTITLDDDSDYNYATISDGTNSFDVLLGDGSGTFKVQNAGTYTVTFGKTELYSVTYTDDFGGNTVDAYYVRADDTDRLTITLPVLEKTSSHEFAGWATSADADNAEFTGGSTYVITGNVNLYAIWTDIPTYTVTFYEEDGTKISEFTAYEGAKLTLPENSNYHKYGYDLIGWAKKGSDIPVTVVPGEDVSLYPIYKAKTGTDTVVYLNGTLTENGDGKTPTTAFNHIQSAVDAVKDSGGTVVVTGVTSFRNSTVSPQISPTYNNAGDIVFTSFDKDTGIDYRASYDSTTKKFDGGAYIYYTNGMNFGQTVMTGKITFENCILAKSKATYLNLDGHPVEIGKGVSVYQGTDTFSESTLQIRGLGESGAVKSNPEGLDITLNTLDAGNYSFTAGGAGDATISGLRLTVDSPISQNIALGGNNATLTVDGDILLTVNGAINGFSYSNLEHISGNVTLLTNNNVNVDYTNTIPEGYALRIVKCEDGFAVLSHGEDASKAVVKTEPTMYTHVVLFTEDGSVTDTVKLEDYIAALDIPVGNYVIGFTNDPAFSVTFDTLCDAVLPKMWNDSNTEVTIPGGVKNLGYLFEGWKYGDVIYKEGDTFTMPSENIILTAIWSEAPIITLTLDANGYGEAPEAVSNYIYEYSTLPVLSSDKAYFIGWSESPDATYGVLNYKHLESRTLYAIWQSGDSVYTVHGYYSEPYGCYMADVYIEGASADMGRFTQNFSDKMTYLDIVGSYGISTEAQADDNSVTVTWTADDEEYRISDRRLLFTLRYSCAKENIEMLKPEETVWSASACMLGEEVCLAKTVTAKDDVTTEGSVSGIVTLDSREFGNTARKETMLYVIDRYGDTIFTEKLEGTGTSERYVGFDVTLPLGNYTLRIVKAGYMERAIPITVTEGELEISDTPMFGGDIPDEKGLGDGYIDIDDFIRVLRGFSTELSGNTEFIRSVDINEDGVINVSDLSIIKNRFGGTVAASLTVVPSVNGLSETAQTAADIINGRYPSCACVGNADENCIILSIDENMKLRDWKMTRRGTVMTITAGSEDALIHGVETLVSVSKPSGSRINVPACLDYRFPYTFDEINIAGNALSEYAYVVSSTNDEIAMKVYSVIDSYLTGNYGYSLDIKTEKGADSDKEILIGDMSSVGASLEDEESEIRVVGSKIHAAYNGEYSPEITAYNFIEQMISKYHEGYATDTASLVIPDGYVYNDSDNVSSQFLLMSDTHIESDFLENGRDVYTGWKPDFQALIETYGYINENFKDLTFGLLCGDQLNTGYSHQPEFLNAERDNYFRTLDSLNLHKNSKTEENLAEKFDFAKTESFVERNVTYYYPELNSRVIAIQGNHDTGVEEFYRECAFTDGNTRFICFFASYVGLPAPEGTYKSTGEISDATIEFIENELIKASSDDSIEHIILVCHWAISQEENFKWPIYDACAENGYSDNRQKLLGLAEQYGCDFYINGHEHNPNYPIGKAGSLYNINIGSTTSRWAVVEIHNRKIVFDIYSTAVANTETGEIITPVAFVKRVTHDLTPREILTRK